MNTQLICSSSLLIASILLMTIEGFQIMPLGSKIAMTTTTSRQQRTLFSSTPVIFMSETAEETVASNTEFEMTPEEAAAKRKVQRERNTLFVGNLPFGTYYIACV